MYEVYLRSSGAHTVNQFLESWLPCERLDKLRTVMKIYLGGPMFDLECPLQSLSRRETP